MDQHDTILPLPTSSSPVDNTDDLVDTDNARKYTALALKIEIERKCLEGAENMIAQLTDSEALDLAHETLNESQRVLLFTSNIDK
jgi:hypothetical protein